MHTFSDVADKHRGLQENANSFPLDATLKDITKQIEALMQMGRLIHMRACQAELSEFAYSLLNQTFVVKGYGYSQHYTFIVLYVYWEIQHL